MACPSINDRHEVFDEYGKMLSKVEKPTGGGNIRSQNVQRFTMLRMTFNCTPIRILCS